MNSFVTYIKESYDELVHHVTWPTWPELLSSANLVLIASIMIAITVFLMDTVANSILDFIYTI
ncbi:MAG TPA: preprotein translocase subunit SecE [Saprospiraceae bacterium]|nr:preprotein translocase subunit SecE [Saprospiraceae bacterium]